MADTSTLTLTIGADLAPYWEVTTAPGGSTPQNMTGWALELAVRRVPDDAIVLSKTTGAGITIGNGSGTGSRATVTIAAADITHPPGRAYYGTLWRTGSGTKSPLWTGPVVLSKAAQTA